VSAVQLDERFERPDMFDLVAFWDAWSAEFEASRPCVAVTVRASAEAVHAFPEVFGEAVRAAIDTASPPDECGWRTITLTFEHARAACHRLLGFGADVEIIAPTHVRRLAVDTSRATVRMYDT
jgi:predicted DNA-binding transcriptional regulator YafY